MQSVSQCSSSDDHIPVHERKWEDITANEYSHTKDLGHQISKFVGKFVRNGKVRDREADGAIHWRLIRQKLKFTFTKQGGDIFTDRDWINHIWKGNCKTARIHAALYCLFELLKGHTGRDLIETELMGRIYFSFGNNSYFTEDAHSF